MNPIDLKTILQNAIKESGMDIITVLPILTEIEKELLASLLTLEETEWKRPEKG